uniref:Replication protein A subunit n=1 Tax=Ciona intestinalis TaxID=7719 RepID=H2XWZ0_CIOIN|nr:replication protein A 70 kDa DNA-binding subunit [Ciona intestinalis]|eukprot:XP_002127939.1 replication protein A 70 kDa DNA-binding subunit [Ciona intestinalis]
MSSSIALTHGAVQALLRGDEVSNPVLQCLSFKKVQGPNIERIKLALSDGVHSFGTVMLGTNLNHLVNDGILDANSIVRLTHYQSPKMVQNGKKVIICLSLDVVQSGNEVGERIGNPVNYAQASANDGRAVQNENLKPNQNRMPASAMQSPKPTGKMSFGGKGDAPTTPGGTQTRVMPIGSLTPYQNKWAIRARVTQKGAMREWKNARGEGKLFSFTVLDDSGDIKVTCFKEEADKFFSMVEVGKVFCIANATLKPANPQYNSTTHDYEMTLRRDTVITLSEDDDAKLVPKIQYNFKKISELGNHVNTLVDTIGILKSAEDLSSVMIRSQNREAKVRKINLVDESNAEIQVTLWGQEAEKFTSEESAVVVLKSAKVSDFGGCSMSTIGSTTVTINPDIPEAFSLKQWYETGGKSQATQVLTTGSGGGGNMAANWKTLADIKTENLGTKEKPDYITVKATVLYCKKENILYQACPNDQCNKKVVDLQNGSYRCEKCNSESPNFKYRVILNMHMADEFDSTWVTCFQDQAEILLNMTAQQLGDLKDTNEQEYEAALKSVDFKSYFFKLRVKSDKFNDEERTRVTIMNVSPMSNVDYIKKLTTDIDKLMNL